MSEAGRQADLIYYQLSLVCLLGRSCWLFGCLGCVLLGSQAFLQLLQLGRPTGCRSAGFLLPACVLECWDMRCLLSNTNKQCYALRTHWLHHKYYILHIHHMSMLYYLFKYMAAGVQVSECSATSRYCSRLGQKSENSAS